VRFFVAAVPEDASKYVKLYDSKKGDAKDATAKTTFKGKTELLVQSIPMLVKDQSTMLSNHFHKIHILAQQTADKKKFQGFFRDITPEQVLKEKDAKQTVNDSLKLLTRFNVWIEATVKCNPDGVIFMTEHTQLKEY
jgi:hypothetical protein